MRGRVGEESCPGLGTEEDAVARMQRYGKNEVKERRVEGRMTQTQTPRLNLASGPNTNDVTRLS